MRKLLLVLHAHPASRRHRCRQLGLTELDRYQDATMRVTKQHLGKLLHAGVADGECNAGGEGRAD